MTTIPLSEVFGPTWQGEGPHMGRLCAFVRLGLCNLTCEWCDTPYTWDNSRYDVAAECPDTPVDVIHERLDELWAGVPLRMPPMVVLSGGEPLIHRTKLDQLLVPGWEWHVETNGTIPPPDWWLDRVEHTTVSPKVATGDPLSKRIKPSTLASWAELADGSNRVSFKFVVTQPNQLADIAGVMLGAGIPHDTVWIMPEGTEPTILLEHHQAIAAEVLAYGFNTTTRLQTLLWGNERGR